jgi:N-acetylated-alpha-linked acidic dipeptidase
MVGNPSYKPTLQEQPLAEDKTSGQVDEQLPTYNAYSVDGDVTAELVYVNQGIPRDYEELARRGIDVKGKIVIARYGGSWRGIKPKVAAENGAIGCILYSDPRDDGYVQGDVYPVGPFKNETGVQRGSVQDMPFYPGDPSTPNMASTKDVDRLAVSEIKTLTRIPVMPISYSDAQPLLEILGGPVAPGYWRGGLPITYHIGPSKTKVHFKLEFNWNIVEAQNVIATMEGSTYPDEWVMRGNHHDGWVNGAADPISGMVALMEEARIVGNLAKQGDKPKRTIKYAAWDAEEPGLIGSVEWVEDHAEELKKHMVIYINTDGNSRGFFGMGGSHTLEKYINEAALTVVDPQKGVSISERARSRREVTGKPEESAEATNRKNLRISPLGSGSDYSPFLQHLGIASLNIGFGGEGSGGDYHSIFDSYDMYKRFKDPDFVYGATLAKIAGRLTLRMANAEILPFDFTGFTDNVAKYAKEVEELADKMREQTEKHNAWITDGTYEQTLDPKKSLMVPEKKDPVPFINFAPLQNAMVKLEAATAAYNTALQNAEFGQALSKDKQIKLNNQLMMMEQYLAGERGLPRRDWYKHKIYAPGFYTGYGVKKLPGIREAIEERYWKEVSEEMDVLAQTIESFSAQIDKASQLLNN